MEIVRALANRCDLLGIELGPLALLGVDVLVLLALAGGIVRRCETERGGPARRLLASGLLVLSIVVLSATVLGGAHLLSARKMLASHLTLLALFGVAEWSRGRPVGGRALLNWLALPLAALLAPWRQLASRGAWSRRGWLESAVLAALLAVLVLYLVLALFTPPLNFDSNTYRLSRIAHWLQEGSLYHFPTNDDRQNWIGQNADLVMLWLTSFFRREFPLVKLAQYGGGILACLAVYELAAFLGMARLWRLGAALTLTAIPTVGTQFISSQNDLFVAGCLTAGLAFLPRALGAANNVEWLYVGLGAGLAVGTKATVLYWLPGLVALALGWALIERTPWRRIVAVGVYSLAVAGLLCSFNLVLNRLDYESPLAPKRHLGFAADLQRGSRGTPWSSNLLGMLWQLFEPHSNPVVPAIVHEPGFDRLLERLAEMRPGYRTLRGLLPQQGGWRTRGLNEDEASFGLVVPAAVLLSGLLALAASLRVGRVEHLRVAVLFVSLAAFVGVFGRLAIMNVNQFRYFCLVGPVTALLATALFSHGRSSVVRALGVVFLGAQLATAIYVGMASRNQGWQVLENPDAARWHRTWLETRQLVAAFGERPRDIGLALYSNSWLAPLYRSPVAHRWRPITKSELADVRSLRNLLDERKLDALLVDPVMLPFREEPGIDIRLLGDWTSRRALCRRLGPEEEPSPAVFVVDGLSVDGRMRQIVRLRFANWRSDRFEIRLRNDSPTGRQVALRDGRLAEMQLAAGAIVPLAVSVGPIDWIEIETGASAAEGSAVGRREDESASGLLVEPAAETTLGGVYSDGWSGPAVKVQLSNWMLGRWRREVWNPSPLERTVRATSSLATATWRLAPDAKQLIELHVAPQDQIEIEISPPFVPRYLGINEDERELGLRWGEPGATLGGS